MLGVDLERKKYIDVYWWLRGHWNLRFLFCGWMEVPFTEIVCQGHTVSKWESPLDLESKFSMKPRYTFLFWWHSTGFFNIRKLQKCLLHCLPKIGVHCKGSQRISLFLVHILSAESFETLAYLDTTSSMKCSHSSPLSLKAYKTGNTGTRISIKHTVKP